MRHSTWLGVRGPHPIAVWLYPRSVDDFAVLVRIFSHRRTVTYAQSVAVARTYICMAWRGAMNKPTCSNSTYDWFDAMAQCTCLYT